ncbi:MAG: VTT domain-containing protein [Bdellovibrionaceae bacterium]|nr:VTT domain-containing protein [Pseudobdellovibrionaceae bacterium]
MATKLFRPTVNCWRTNDITKARMLIDSADFFRAVHAAIVNASRIVIVIGWEIDSTTRLLRGDDEKNSEAPSVFIDLINWKARQNPELQVYLLRWDSSVAFISEREFWPEYVWTHHTPENIHFSLDDTIPIGGSHHQKLILVDDEFVFSGGMDIARQRWDERAHRIVEPERSDANGPYGPYHDVQLLMTGPIVEDFAELMRWRWRQATGISIPKQKNTWTTSPEALPGGCLPNFTGVVGAIARTIPKMPSTAAFHEVRQMYLDLIDQAEEFIYIENQFLTSVEVAKKLNEQLRSKPPLKVLLVSSYNPQGVLESEGMWAGRIDFNKILTDGIDESRAKIVCTGIKKPDGEMLYKRIHSKVLIVDDRYLMVSSSNINNRSMELDTECDVIIAAGTDEHRACIRNVRDDLRLEHESNGYSFHPLHDEKYTSQSFQTVAARFADPSEPLIAGTTIRNPTLIKILAGGIIIAAVVGLFHLLNLNLDWFHVDNIRSFLMASRSSPWALPTVIAVYVVGGFILFPVTVISLVTAAVYGSIWGPIYGMCGALTSASVMFWIGRWVGQKGLRRFFGERLLRIDRQFADAGILGVAFFRMIPVAPFSIVNLAAGISSLTFWNFIAGNFLGFLPAFIVKGLVGDSLTQIFLDPTPKSIGLLIAGGVLWIALMIGTYLLTRRWKKRREHET